MKCKIKTDELITAIRNEFEGEEKWEKGGCMPFAYALHEILAKNGCGSRLMCIGPAEHCVVEFNGKLIDYSGLLTAERFNTNNCHMDIETRREFHGEYKRLYEAGGCRL